MKSDTFALVTEAVKISRRMDKDDARLKEIKKLLTKQGKGEYLGEGGKALVIEPTPGIKPSEEDVEKVKALLTKEQFNKLFDTETVESPVKNFRDVIAAVLTPAKAKRVIKICEKKSSTQVRIS